MEIDEKGLLFLKNRKLVVDAVSEVSSWLAGFYGEFPKYLHGRSGFEWLQDIRFNVSPGFVQLYRPSWPNENWQGVHLEITHSRDTILEGMLQLHLHIESETRKNPKLWPELGRLILSTLGGTHIGRVGRTYVERHPPSHHSTLAMAEIPIQTSTLELVDVVCEALQGFRLAIDAVDDALWRCCHRPIFLTRFRPSDDLPDLRWGEEKSTGGQEIRATGGLDSGRCLEISRTRQNYNHKSKRSILRCGRFRNKVRPGMRLYFSVILKSDNDVWLWPLCDSSDTGIEHAWEFGNKCINTNGRWERLVWDTVVPEIPNYDVWDRGGVQYLLTDTGDDAAAVGEIELGILELV